MAVGNREPEPAGVFVVMYDTLGRGIQKGSCAELGAPGFMPESLSGKPAECAGREINNLIRDRK